jgi:formylglycine-generating enzyme required for sulfatase activity
VNPHGPATDSFSVLRGGSWNGDATFLRAAADGGDVPYDAVNVDFGLRGAADGTP